MAYPLLDFSNSQESTGDDFICTECGEGFNQYPKLINHMSVHGPIGPFSVNNESGCDKPIEFVLHDNGTLTMVDRSAISNFSFLFGKPTTKPVWTQISSQDSLPPNKTADKEFNCCRCERCGQVFRSQKSLQQHQRYRPLEQGFKCTLCCRDFYDRESLRNHLQFHASERFYSCGHCGKRFLKKETLSLHQKEWHETIGTKSKFVEDHENDVDKSYPCKMCGLRFFWLSDLQSHLINHSHVRRSTDSSTQKENKQEPDESSCKNSASSPDDSGDRSYRCGSCGGHYASLSELKDHHASKHPGEASGEEPSESAPPVRRHSYNNIGIMRQIVAKHQMQRLDPLRPRMRGRPRGGGRYRHTTKLYPCKQCHRVFVHSSSLSRHMRYHKGTLHTCLYCGRHFPQRCDVTRHVAMYHDVQLKTEDEMGDDQEDADTPESPEKLINNDDAEGHQETEDFQKSSKGADNEKSSGTPPASLYKQQSNYKCKDCGRVFGLFSVYQRHVNYHWRDPNSVVLSCPRCPCRFTYQTALDRHLEDHDKETAKKAEKAAKKEAAAKEATKDVVSKGTDMRSLSEANSKKIPSGSVLYECTECTQTFTDLQIFLQHQSAHG